MAAMSPTAMSPTSPQASSPRMTPGPRTIRRDSLAAEALNQMETFKITALIVEDENGSPTGVLHMHDLLRAGLA